MRLALAQISSSPDRQRNIDRVLQAMDDAGAAGADLVVFPEVVLDRFFPAQRREACPLPVDDFAETIPGPTTELLQAKAKEHGLVTVFNLYERDGDKRYDSSPVIDADGTLLGVTRMLHICDYEGFHEQDYYDQGPVSSEQTGVPVYDTAAGKIGVAICYDRHYPEVMRGLALAGADLVVVPQAGTLGEWPEGLFEGELQVAAFQNGYFAALSNRVGVEDTLTFAGESFVVDPQGHVLTRGKKLEEDLVVIDLDLSQAADAVGRKLFRRDRRPELYGAWLTREETHG